MKKITFLLFTFCFTILSYSQSVATYTITFESNWNSSDHGTIPSSGHWSDLVGATHNSNHIFWEEGSLATLGIEKVAETGSNGTFNNEVDDEITNGNADQWIQQVFDAPNDESSGVSITINVNENFPLLTLLSMIAPSPDWFVGINSLSLLDGSNDWKTSVVLDMYPYDSGTEEGTGYTISNSASSPHVNIFDRTGMTPFNNVKVGTLTITLDEVLSTQNIDFKSGIKLTPNPANDIISIFNSSQENINTIEIFDVLGKSVKTSKINSTENRITLNVQDLSSGIYLVKFSTFEGNSSLKKLIIN